jgi:hypothetical protein
MVAISPDGRWILTGSHDKTARAWRWQWDDLVARAGEVGRNFDEQEWKLYFPREAYRMTFPDLPVPTDSQRAWKYSRRDDTLLQNLACRQASQEFPKASASHTSRYDKVERANDGIVDYDLLAWNRWTAYESSNPTDWLQIEFETERRFSRVELAIYDEGPGAGVQTPEGYEIEFWDGNQWCSVPGQARFPETPTGNQWNNVQFEPVKAKKVRVVFTHNGRSRSGVTEIAVWP